MEEEEFNQFTEKDGIVTINDGVTEIPHEVFYQHEMKGLVIPILMISEYHFPPFW